MLKKDKEKLWVWWKTEMGSWKSGRRGMETKTPVDVKRRLLCPVKGDVGQVEGDR